MFCILASIPIADKLTFTLTSTELPNVRPPEHMRKGDSDGLVIAVLRCDDGSRMASPIGLVSSFDPPISGTIQFAHNNTDASIGIRVSM